MAIDPTYGMQLQQNNLRMMSERQQLQNAQLQRHAQIQKQVDPVRDAAINAYDEVLKNGGSVDAANAAGQKALDEGLAPLRSGGELSDEEKRQLRTKFDYMPMKAAALSYKDKLAQEEKQAADARAERHLEQEDKRLDTTLATDKSKGWQILTDPTNNKQYRYNPGTLEATTLTGEPYKPGGAQKIGGGNQVEMSDDAANLVAEQVLAGNHMAMTGLARSAANIAKVNNAIAKMAKERGMSGAEIAGKQAEFSGMLASERAIGTRTANMNIAANEVKNMAPLALDLSEKVDRTKFPTLNAILLAGERGTGGVDVVRFAQATNALVYMYAKFLNPNGIPTDADKARATDILSTAWAKGQFKGAVDQIQKEIQVGQTGLSQSKQEVSDQFKDANTRGPKAAAGQDKSASDVAAAYKAGKMSRDEAAKILRDNGWAQ